MRRLVIGALAFGLGAATAVQAGEAPSKKAGKAKTATATRASVAPVPFDVKFERYVLPSGLVVILHEDHRTPQVAVNLWFRVGSKDERGGRTGFAHLFEHLMFMGTKKIPNGEFDSIMEAEGGQNNATTAEDRTNYFESGPRHLLETFLWLESDRLSTLADDMTKEKVDLQRDVVKNERRQSYENRPYGKVELVLPEHMYPEGHPYHHPVIGSHEDLTAASVDDVKAFFKTYYVPSNAALVVAGDFQSADAKKFVEKYFGWMKRVAEPPHATPEPAKLAKDDRVQLEDAVELSQLTLAWHSPQALSDGDAACDLLSGALGNGKSSRLYKALVYDKKIAQKVVVEQRGMRYGGNFVITVTAQPGHDAAELERETLAEIKRLEAAPITNDELSRSRAVVETQTLRSAERLLAMADLLNTFEYYFGDPGQLGKKLLARYDGVDAAQIATVAKEVLGQPHLSVLVEPKTKSAPVASPIKEATKASVTPTAPNAPSTKEKK